MVLRRSYRTGPAVLLILVCMVAGVQGARPDWQRQEVDWRAGNGRITAISYPAGKPAPLWGRQAGRSPTKLSKKIIPAANYTAATAGEQPGAIVVNVIESPPLDGFIPWVATVLTDERSLDYDAFAVPEGQVVGDYLTGDPQNNYVLGTFDTGAGLHIVGHAAAEGLGLNGGYLTGNTVVLGGATGTVEAAVSYPVALFIDGLAAIDPNSLLLDTSGMAGESNVSLAVGYEPGPNEPDLPTAIGSPLSVYYAAAFNNEVIFSIVRDANEYTSPDIRLFETGDPDIPALPNNIPLELRPPAGAVAYWLDFDPCTLEFYPTVPSVIMGDSMQSSFFVHSVNLTEGEHSIVQNDGFLLDTGAQVSIISSSVSANLGLNPADPDFEVEIRGVNGETTTAPGFYIDTLDIPAEGEWLSFTNVPVIRLNVSSPEGGTLEGIIGMNLLVEINFVLRGEAFGVEPPSLQFVVNMPGDIAPEYGDGRVELLDLAGFADAWLTGSDSDHWNPQCDLAGPADNKIDFYDFAVFAQLWLEGT